MTVIPSPRVMCRLGVPALVLSLLVTWSATAPPSETAQSETVTVIPLVFTFPENFKKAHENQLEGLDLDAFTQQVTQACVETLKNIDDWQCWQFGAGKVDEKYDRYLLASIDESGDRSSLVLQLKYHGITYPTDPWRVEFRKSGEPYLYGETSWTERITSSLMTLLSKFDAPASDAEDQKVAKTITAALREFVPLNASPDATIAWRINDVNRWQAVLPLDWTDEAHRALALATFDVRCWYEGRGYLYLRADGLCTSHSRGVPPDLGLIAHIESKWRKERKGEEKRDVLDLNLSKLSQVNVYLNKRNDDQDPFGCSNSVEPTSIDD